MPVVISGTTELPAQRAFSTLKSEAARFVLMPTDTTADSIAGDGINDGIRRLNTRPWEWAIQFQEITLTASQDQYEVAARFLAPRSTELLDASGNVMESNLAYYDAKTFVNDFYDRRMSGDPMAYTVYARHETGTITLDRPCSSGFVSRFPKLRLWYYQRLPYLSGASDVLDAPSEVESYVLWHAKHYLATIYDVSKAGVAKTEREETWMHMVRQNLRLNLTDWR
jgi:hypothetical protein